MSNTLFAYFKKSPKSSSPSQSSSKPNQTPNSKREKSINTTPKTTSSEKAKPRKEEKKGSQKSPFQFTQDTKTECEFKLHDVVWAKLEGHPYWPALVCRSPGSETNFIRGKKSSLDIHVQFFDKPPSRAWIKAKFVKQLTGPKHPDVPSMKDVAWKEGVENACKALEMDKGSRVSLIVHHEASDNEDVEDDLSDTENNQLSQKKKRSGDNGTPNNPKRRRIIVPSDDESEEEYKPEETISSDDDEAEVVESDDPSPDPSPEPSPVKTPKRKKTTTKDRKVPQLSLSSSKSVANGISPVPNGISPVRSTTKSKLASFSFSEDATHEVRDGDGKVWTHLKLDWLKPERIKDIKGNPKEHPDYDPRTLFVPSSFKQGLTPAMRQWWEMKSHHFDTVLFFKVGKFYELYHMDAVTGINELNLREMAGDHAHSGFPEISYGRYSSMLIQKGYKVARVEQTETPQMMEERCKKMTKPSKFDKVVNREICAITSKGTCTFGIQDGAVVAAGSNFLLSLAEKEKSNGDSIYGISFVDTSIGKFYMGQFSDDRHCSRLRTLIAHFPPAQVLFEKNHSSKKTQIILNGCLTSTLKEALTSGREFWDATTTLKNMEQTGYFKEDISNESAWPDVIKKMMDPDDPLHQKAQVQNELAVKSLGACIWYLKKCFIDEELLSMKNFEEYVPPDDDTEQIVSSPIVRQHMVLDGVTLRNLEVLENSIGTTDGTLLDAMEHCYTPFGKRLFHQWMCSPLCNPAAINDRLNAVEDLQKIQGILEDVSKSMKKLPDLERLLSRIHAQGSARRSESHPDSRAVFYEESVYSKRKIGDLIIALQGFKAACDINHLVNDPKLRFSSTLLKEVVLKTNEGGRFPHLKDTLHFFDNAFDHEEAKKLGKIIPSKGVDEEFDLAERAISESKKKLDAYLDKQRKHFSCKVTYYHSGKNRFQLEVPEHACKHASSSHELVSQKKGFKRFWTSEIKAELARLVSCEEKKEIALKDIMRRLFHQFDKHYKKWESAVACLSVLDCLLSLVHYHLNSQVTMCRPKVVLPDENGTPYLKIMNGCHPALIKRLSGGDFIPNDISIGNNENSDGSKVVIVTGPNMGGKSTLMRQAGLLTIMAQMGSYVPAEEFELTPVDRVFTRLGASDRILEGESTFFVELSETASILKHATEHSLVLLDELGRGTATYDGTAIAFAVAQDLASRLRCRTLFSTHYHSLVEHFSDNPHVRLGHMSCMVENENEEDPTQETITFLYKFVEGACPKSYGFNAARLAGIPDSIIRSGFQKAKEFELKSNHMKFLRLLFTASSNGINALTREIQEKLTML